MDRRQFLTRSGLIAVSSIGGASFLVGCAPQSSNTGTGGGGQRSADPDLKNLVYVTPFQHILSHIDVYVAVQEGYFEEEGLFITAVGGTGTASSVSQVVAEQGVYGKAASVITCPLIADQATEIVTVAQKDQVSQYSIASSPDAPLTSPEMFQGKTIGVISQGGTTELLLDAMSVAAGLDPAGVNKVVTGADVGSQEFLRRGEVDGFITFLGSETSFRQMGVELNYLNTDDYAKLPGDSYFVTTATAEQQPEDVVSFLRACRKAWDFIAVPDNVDAVLEAMGAYNEIEVSDVELAKAKIEGEVKLATAPGDGGYLSIDEGTWESAMELMRKSGIVKDQSRPLSDFVTTEFIDQA